MKKLAIILTIFILYSNLIAQNQDEKTYKNNLNAEVNISPVFGSFIGLKISYERLIKDDLTQSNSHSIKVSSGLGGGGWEGPFWVSDLNYVYCRGMFENHFEFGLGVAMINELYHDFSGVSFTQVLPKIDLGYRRIVENKFWRIGLGLPNGFYVGVGFSF